MSEKFYCMAKDCVFLQTNDPTAQIDGNPAAGSVLAKKLAKKKYEFVKLTETEAFILRLLLQPLGIAPIKEALAWKSKVKPDEEAREEDKLSDGDALTLIQGVIERCTAGGFIQPVGEWDPIIKDLKIKKQEMFEHHHAAGQGHKPRHNFQKLHLDASINQLGPIVIRFTFPPLR